MAIVILKCVLSMIFTTARGLKQLKICLGFLNVIKHFQII